VAPYLGPDIGQPFAAKTAWGTRSVELSAQIISELKAISEQAYYPSSKKLISSIAA
jgi:hypothetical protein